MQLPEWKIPADVDRAKLRLEVRYLLGRYLVGTAPNLYICRSCENLSLETLLRVVRASLFEPDRTLEVNMVLEVRGNLDLQRLSMQELMMDGSLSDRRIAWLSALRLQLDQHSEKEQLDDPPP